jgi:DNA-binding CsgD family transcriptional regulator
MADSLPSNSGGKSPAYFETPGHERMTVELSAREQQIVVWMRRGMTNKEIARELGISDTTVKTHAHNIFHKMNISGRVRLLQKLQNVRLPVTRVNGKTRKSPPRAGSRAAALGTALLAAAAAGLGNGD